MNSLQKLLSRFREYRMSMRTRLTLGLGSIAAMLLLSSIISVSEYSRMSDYVSELIATNINSINISQRLANDADSYNLKILDAIGSDDIMVDLGVDEDAFMSRYGGLVTTFVSDDAAARVDSLAYSYTAYMLTSLELKNALMSDFIDARAWYFDRLQPRYQRLKSDIEKLNDAIYMELKENSETFQAGFYRSIMPGVVSVGAGLLLVLLFLIFILIYFVRPLKKMLSGMENYRSSGKRYTCTFDGDDELVSLNEGLTELVDENVELKKRVTKLREERERLIESSSVSEI